MKAGAKTILAVLGLAAIAGGAYAFSTSHNEDPPPPDAPDPGAPGNQKTGGDFVPPQPKPPAPLVIYSAKNTVIKPGDTALVKQMQARLGLKADGIWGPQTKAALLKLGLVSNFSIQQLEDKIAKMGPSWFQMKGLMGI